MRRRTAAPVVLAGLAGLAGLVVGLGVWFAVGAAADDPGADDAGADDAGAVPDADDASPGPDADDASPGPDAEAPAVAPTDVPTDLGPRTEPGDADEPYDYGELTYSDRADPQGTIGRLQVPDDVLAAMTSEALAWTVLDFPYFANYAASSDRDGGVAFLAQQCNALEVLLTRSDAVPAVRAVRDEFVASGRAESDEYGSIKVFLLELILAKLGA